MTREQFQRRWKTLDYNRAIDEGSKSTPLTIFQAHLPARVWAERQGSTCCVPVFPIRIEYGLDAMVPKSPMRFGAGQHNLSM